MRTASLLLTLLAGCTSADITETDITTPSTSPPVTVTLPVAHDP